jgi:hypothetical protein
MTRQRTISYPSAATRANSVPSSGGSGPTLGAHNSRADNDQGVGNPDPATVALTGKTAGSAIVVFSMGDLARMSTPTDTSGTSFTQRGTDQAYTLSQWPGFGPRVHANLNVSGTTGYTVSVDKDNAFPLEEITVAVFEVIGGSSIVQSQGNAVPPGAGVGYPSPSITVSAPALILAAWTGDGDTPINPKDVAASAGWTIIESAFRSDTSYVQFAVAYRQVSSAGTYNLTWTPTANQGAAMQMLAVVQ